MLAPFSRCLATRITRTLTLLGPKADASAHRGLQGNNGTRGWWLSGGVAPGHVAGACPPRSVACIRVSNTPAAMKSLLVVTPIRGWCRLPSSAWSFLPGSFQDTCHVTLAASPRLRRGHSRYYTLVPSRQRQAGMVAVPNQHMPMNSWYRG